jgi:hypothetical protein
MCFYNTKYTCPEDLACIPVGHSLIRRRQKNSFMFVKAKGNQTKIGQYDNEFMERLTQIKMLKPHLFEPGLNIVEACCLRRSLRSGLMSEEMLQSTVVGGP